MVVKPRSTLESTTTDFVDGVADGDRGQTCATTKCTLPEFSNRVGRETEVKPVQPLKASSPSLVTEVGMETEVKPVQEVYLQIALYQRFAS